MTIHTPVLTKEVLQYLNPTENEDFIDCTIGEGGHTKLILEKTKPLGRVLGIDLDPGQIETDKWSMADYGNRLILENNSYANLKDIIRKNGFGPISGILLDIGMSSVQLEGSQKGFSFQAEQVLDMRYDDRFNNLTAEKIINEWPKQEIEKIIKEYGEEKFSRKIVEKIIEERSRGRIRTTLQLVEVIKKAIPAGAQKGKIHCATRTFQALRIAVNDELGNLQRVLPQAIEVLAPGGRLAVISFHSLEDRIVKEFFKKNKDIKILTKKPVTAGSSEIGENPRARSAKLRVAVKNQ